MSDDVIYATLGSGSRIVDVYVLIALLAGVLEGTARRTTCGAAGCNLVEPCTQTHHVFSMFPGHVKTSSCHHTSCHEERIYDDSIGLPPQKAKVVGRGP